MPANIAALASSFEPDGKYLIGGDPREMTRAKLKVLGHRSWRETSQSTREARRDAALRRHRYAEDRAQRAPFGDDLPSPGTGGRGVA